MAPGRQYSEVSYTADPGLFAWRELRNAAKSCRKKANSEGGRKRRSNDTMRSVWICVPKEGGNDSEQTEKRSIYTVSDAASTGAFEFS